MVQTAEIKVVEEVKVVFVQKVFDKIDISIFFQIIAYELKVISFSFSWGQACFHLLGAQDVVVVFVTLLERVDEVLEELRPLDVCDQVIFVLVNLLKDLAGLRGAQMLLGKEVRELTVAVLAMLILGREGGGEMLDRLHHLNFVGRKFAPVVLLGLFMMRFFGYFALYLLGKQENCNNN